MTQSSQLKNKDSVSRSQSESISKGGTSLPAISLKRISNTEEKRSPVNVPDSVPIQRVDEVKPFQLKSEFSSGTETVSVKPFIINRTIQRKNDTGLPDTLKSGIEALSNYSMDDVKVHYNR